MGLADERVDKGGLAVVQMSDHGHIPDHPGLLG